MPASVPDRRATVEATVLETVRALLRELGTAQAADRVGLRSSLERDLGLGSLERVELLVRLESALAVRLPESAAQTAETPGDWVGAILAVGPETRADSRWPIAQPSREAAAPPLEAATFAEVLRRQTEIDPARVHIHLLDGDTGQDLSHAQLYESAGRVAAGLAASGLRPGETVAIMLPTCADFFSSFLGVMLAGGIAVPIYPPARLNQLEEYVRRQALILRNAEVRFLISFDRARAVANVLGTGLPSLREALSAADLAERGRGLALPARTPDEVFFIQYTSGSTGDPKGVTLTHANVLANIRGIGFAVQAVPSDVVVSWLPLYHDMGLIGSWLFSLYYGFPITILSPLDFLARPERWLWALSDSGGTLCPAPNFAFELCVRKIRDEALEGVDLARWRVAINAGEPVLPATLARFTDRFRRWGFDPRSFMPFYGLAESSVALTYPPLARGPAVDRIARAAFETEGRAAPAQGGETREVLEFVGNGVPLPGHEVRVVDEDGQAVPERIRGRILFRGPSRTPGYFRNPQATEAVLDREGWLDSGDLGYLAGGELHVTGRLKDCIIKAGHNIIPQDVELAAWEVEGVRKGCVAAFGSPDPRSGTERLVVVAETRITDPGQRRRIQAGVTETVAAKVGIPPDDVALASPGTVPKTSSGKIQRRATRRLYERNEISGRGPVPPWLQLARLWLRGAAAAAARGAIGGGRSLRAAGAAALRGSIAAAFGLAARLTPGPRAAGYVIGAGAKMLLGLSGIKARGSLEGNGTRLWLVNRAHRLDPVVLASVSRDPFVFADERSFAELEPGEAFLLEPLLARPAKNGDGPARGALHDAILAALQEGRAVASFADNAAGEAPARTRFRAEGFLAADRSRAPVVPVSLRRRPDGSIEVVAAEPLSDLELNGNLAAKRAAARVALAQAAALPQGLE